MIDHMGTGFRGPQSGNGFQQFLLSAAGNARNAQNLSAEGLEGHMVQRLHAIWCQDGKILYFQAKMARLHQGTVDVQRDSMAHHHVGELLGIGVPGGHISDITSLAQNSYPVGDIHYLVELVGDDDHGFAVGFHVAHDIKEPVGFLRSEDGGGLVQNQNVCAPVEHFDDFHRLLFGDRFP